ncbi:MAG: xylulokinase [Microbacteriaceae bacterium]|nr:xylulokinase [Microbacteriaceae bacterium]
MILSHDLGTTGDKATLVDAAGAVVAAVSVPYDTDFGPRGKAEQDPEAWWVAVCSATAALLAARPDAATAIEGVSFSGQMMGAVLLDSHGVPVRPAIIWADTRSVVQAQRLVDRFGMREAYGVTGHRFNATYSLSKLMWVRDTEPEAFGRTRRMVLAKDYVVYRLTGVLATDPSDASSTNAFDQARGDWSDEILAAAEVPRGLLPDIVPSASVVGPVTPEAAAACGLRAGTPVVMGGGDGPMAALGSGIVDAASGAYAYLGSSSWVSLAAPQPLHDEQMRTMTFNHVVPGMFVPTATMQAGGASLQWVVEVLEPSGADRYEALLDAAADAEASRDGLYFLPHLLGERSPYWNPRARAVFAGLARHHGREHLVRAVLEGVAFNLATGLIAFAENGAAAERIDAIGGAARSPLLMRLFADVWGIPVRRRDLVDEATALGAAIVGGVAVGMFPDYSVGSALSASSAPYEPDAARHAEYAVAHERFVDAYRRLEPWFDAAP